MPVGDRELCLFFDRMAEGVAEIQLLAKPCVPFVLLNDQPFQVDAPGDYLGELFAQPALLEQPEKGVIEDSAVFDRFGDPVGKIYSGEGIEG